MIRLILLSLALYGLFAALKKWVMPLFLKQLLGHPSQSKTHTQTILPCAECELHIPEAEAIIDGEHAFCCEAHRQHWLKKHA